MERVHAVQHADTLIKLFVENQQVTFAGSAEESGARAAKFIGALHAGLVEYLLTVKDE